MGRSGRGCVKTAVAVELCAPRLTCLLLLTVVGPPVVPSCWHSETTAPKQAPTMSGSQLQQIQNMKQQHESSAAGKQPHCWCCQHCTRRTCSHTRSYCCAVLSTRARAAAAARATSST